MSARSSGGSCVSFYPPPQGFSKSVQPQATGNIEIELRSLLPVAISGFTIISEAQGSEAEQTILLVGRQQLLVTDDSDAVARPAHLRV